MAEILIAALSPIGHITPLLAVAQDLVARGDHVTVMTGAAHTDAVHATGAQSHPLPALADFDDLPFDAACRGRTSGIKALNLAIIRLFLAPMPHQVEELAAAMARTRFDAIIVDYGFFGIIPLLLGPPADRPPVLYYSPTPMMLSSRDTAPTGMGLPPGCRTLRAAAQPRAEPALAQRHPSGGTPGRQRDAGVARRAQASRVPARRRRAGRPIHRADGAQLRVPAQRPARPTSGSSVPCTRGRPARICDRAGGPSWTTTGRSSTSPRAPSTTTTCPA